MSWTGDIRPVSEVGTFDLTNMDPSHSGSLHIHVRRALVSDGTP